MADWFPLLCSVNKIELMDPLFSILFLAGLDTDSDKNEKIRPTRELLKVDSGAGCYLFFKRFTPYEMRAKYNSKELIQCALKIYMLFSVSTL